MARNRTRYDIMMKQVGASMFFGLTSIIIVVVNKMVLTTYHFPSFQVLGMGQMVTIIIVTRLAKSAEVVSFPDVSWRQIRKVFPLV